MNSTPPIPNPTQQQQMLLLQQQQQAAQQQLGQQVMHQQMPQQQHPAMSPHGHPAGLQQPMLHHPQQLAAHQQQQPQMQQQLQQQLLQQQQQARLSSIHGISQQPFPLHPQSMSMQHLQQQQFMRRSPVQQQLAQQTPMQLTQSLQHQQQLHLQQQHAMSSPQRHFLQQQQIHAGQQQHDHPQQQGCLPQPPQLGHQQLQLQQQQLHQLHAQHALLQQQQAQHGDAATLAHVGTPKGISSSSTAAAAGSGMLAAPPLGGRSYTPRSTPHDFPKTMITPATIILASAPMEAVQIAARPGSSSTVADLVREAMEAAEASDAADPDMDIYRAAREAEQGFSVHDLLDFTEDIAGLMEAFMNPELAVAAEALELTVQLALDFIDDLVEKGVEHRRQQQDGTRPHRLSRLRQPQLLAEDLLAGLRTHPRKALRCKEALENYRMLEEFKLAFPEDKYLSAPAQGQGQPLVSPSGNATPTGPQPPGPNAPLGQTPLHDLGAAATPQGPHTPLDTAPGRQRAFGTSSTHSGDFHSLTLSPTLRTQDPPAFDNRPRTSPSAANVLQLNP